MKITKAYIDGLVEGRVGNIHDLKCPHTLTQAKNQWQEGVRRGLVLRHFADGTVPADKELADVVMLIRKETGERV